MGRISRIAALCLALAACRKQPIPQPMDASVASPDAAVAAASLYDAQGRLLASRARVEWLEVPVGFEKKANVEKHVIYEARGIALDKLRDFLSSRMLTGNVEDSPHRVLYRAVMPAQGGDAVRLDVLVYERPLEKQLTLDVLALSYGELKPLSVDEAKKAIARDQARAE